MSHHQEFADYIASFGYTSSKQITDKSGWGRIHYMDEKSSSGGYKLTVNPDGSAFGVFGSSKDPEGWRVWKSQSARKMTGPERQEMTRKIKAAQAEQQRILEKQQQRLAGLIQKAMKGYPVTNGGHAYLVRKKTQGNGVKYRRKGNELLIPMYQADGKIWSVQRITASGWKGFFAGGRINGGYYPITGKNPDLSAICITEGFATGDAIHQATGLPVVVAFNAGNLIHVAEAMRRKYPDAKLIFACDNDQWSFRGVARPADVNPKELPGDDPRWIEWREAGKLYNTGVEKAKQAAVKVSGFVVVPPIPETDPDKRTDWNDLLLTDGPEPVKNTIMAVVEHPAMMVTPGNPQSGLQADDGVQNTGGDSYDWTGDFVIPIDAYDDEARQSVSLYAAGEHQKDNEWKERLYFKEDGKMHPKNLGNATLFIENDPVLSNLFCYDEFSHEKIVYRCPPWENVSKFKPRHIKDDDITCLTVALEKRGILQPFNTVARLVSAAIKQNSRNPAVEYFKTIVWDGQKRLDNWLAYYCGATFDDPEYIRQIGRKWLVAGVSRIFEPGCKFDHMLILEGDQGSGKSQTFETLATIHGKKYFDDSIRVSDLGNPSIVPKLQGVMIVEIAELSGFKKKDSSELKQAITTAHDRIIRKYENEATIYPRQFIFGASINPGGAGYLHDETGGRRFWPVRVGAKIDLDALKRDKEQLWAEAVVRYKQGEKLYLETDMYRSAETAQRQRNTVHPWQPDIERMIELTDKVTVDEVWECLGIGQRIHRTKQASEDISKIMTGLGFTQSRRRFDDGRHYCWVRNEQPVVEEEISY